MKLVLKTVRRGVGQTSFTGSRRDSTPCFPFPESHTPTLADVPLVDTSSTGRPGRCDEGPSVKSKDRSSQCGSRQGPRLMWDGTRIGEIYGVDGRPPEVSTHSAASKLNHQSSYVSDKLCSERKMPSCERSPPVARTQMAKVPTSTSTVVQ